MRGEDCEGELVGAPCTPPSWELVPRIGTLSLSLRLSGRCTIVGRSWLSLCYLLYLRFDFASDSIDVKSFPLLRISFSSSPGGRQGALCVYSFLCSDRPAGDRRPSAAAECARELPLCIAVSDLTGQACSDSPDGAKNRRRS